VVVLLAFGVGLAAQMKRNARGIGEHLVILSGGTTVKSFAGFPEGRRIRLVEEDAEILRREIPAIDQLSPEYGTYQQVRRGTSAANPYVTGVYPEYETLRNVFPDSGGRFIDESDMAARRRVAVIGDRLKDLLFGDGQAVGQTVFVRGTPFTVVGVMVKKVQNSSYQQRDEDRIFIPATTYRSVFGDRYIARILYSPKDPDLTESVEKRVYEILGRKYRFDPTDHDALGIWDTNEMMKMFKYLFLGFNTFLGIVGSFTLVVGGIGVANIMYVVVRERTREIGVRRAMGARRTDILGQVLAEAVILVATGATLGFGISIAIVKLAALLPIQEYVGVPTLSPTVLAVTVALLLVIALLAGLFPARRAARLDVVDCLRHGT
jgi:putative ABC transport system permease protein